QPRTPSLTPFCTPAVHNRSIAGGKPGSLQWRSPTSAWIETVTSRELVAGVRDARNGVRREAASVATSGLSCCHGASYGSARDACATSWPALDCDSRAAGRAVLGPTAQVLRRGRLSEGTLCGKVRFPRSRLRGHWPQPKRAPGP